MCLIAYASKDHSQIPAAHLLNGHARNDDAWGIMFPEAGRVRIIRETSTHAAFKTAWNSVPTKTPSAAHFRYGTSGSMAADMAHPFPILEDARGVTLAMMHNGVLSCVFPEGGLSDTAVLIRDILQPQLEARPDLVECDGWRKAMGAVLGDDNKLLFMRADGEVFFVNGHQGKFSKGGVWYSNEYSLVPARPRYTPPATFPPMFYAGTGGALVPTKEKPASFGGRAWSALLEEEDFIQAPDGALHKNSGRFLNEAFGAEEEEADESFQLPDLGELSETELYNWVQDNSPEDITDAIIDLRGGR